MLHHISWDMIHPMQKQKKTSKYKLQHLEKEKLKIFGKKFPRLTQWSALNFLNMYFAKLYTSCDNLQHYFQQLMNHL